PSQHQPGAKVVDCFNKGLAMYDLANYDVICKFDADIIFPTNYLKIVENVYQENPKVAMVSGIVKIKNNDEVVSFQNFLNFEDTSNWTFENISSVKHVRGPIKSYRKKCFLEMNGLRPILGWDNIDVLLANFHGYQTYTEKDLWVKHLRPTAEKYKNQKAIKLGEYFYNIGLSFPLATISSVKSAWKNKSLSEVFVTLNSFLRQKQPLLLTKEETKFVRNYKWKNILQKFNFFQ
ncbi:MAG: glycosyltransferase family 2 protein, partial [Bacteroidetes bacterium]|nr:glycosyltransferase family 2 protein [Bacteroidota bacterium]